jgi:hypothetical protein
MKVLEVLATIAVIFQIIGMACLFYGLAPVGFWPWERKRK